MKKDFVHLVYMLIVLVVAGAMEELVPKIFNVGLPVLLSAAAYSALRRTPVEALLFALAAGGMEDSLSSLPFATSIGFFVAQFALLRKVYVSGSDLHNRIEPVRITGLWEDGVEGVLLSQKI